MTRKTLQQASAVCADDHQPGAAPKPGQWALVLGCRYNVELNGKVVRVLSDPFLAQARCLKNGRRLGRQQLSRIDAACGYIATPRLLPLPSPHLVPPADRCGAAPRRGSQGNHS